MQRICKYCGVEFSGKPDSTACPECVTKYKSTTKRKRTCQLCGVSFLGGPSAQYCSDCRLERQREQNRKYKRLGSSRKLGSKDLCEICGKPYIVNSGTQKYCKDCADEAIKAKDRAKAMQWYTKNTTAKERREVRRAGTAPIACVICGKLFVPHTKSRACSEQCKAIYAKMQMANWEKEHRTERNEYHKKLRKKKENSNEDDN